MVTFSPLPRGDQASPASFETETQIQILLADMEELDRMVTTLQTVLVCPATTATDRLPVAMDRLHALMARIPLPPLGWSAWHSSSLQLALNRGDTETVSSLTDLLESLAVENRYFQPANEPHPASYFGTWEPERGIRDQRPNPLALAPTR